MSFTIPEREELINALKKAGVDSPYIDKNPIDVVGSCLFYTIRDDIKNELYSLEHFVTAHQQYEFEGKEYHGHDVRSRASYICAISREEEPVAELTSNDNEFDIVPQQYAGGWGGILD